VFASADRDLALWTNRQEHLTVLSVAPGDGLNTAYRMLVRALDGLAEILRRRRPGQDQAFAVSERLGYLTSDLGRLGAALHASVLLKLPRLAAMEASHPSSAAGSWRSWAGLRRVKVEPVSTLASGQKVEGYFRISNMDTFLATDEEILSALEEVALRLAIAEQQITTLTADSDQLFPILTSVLSAAEARGESRTSLLSVFSGIVTTEGSEDLSQEVLSAMMREATATPRQELETLAEGNEEEELGSLKDRVRLAMYSKLEDGSLQEALQDAADTSGAQYFSDLPPPPPPADGFDDGDLEADALVTALRTMPRPTPQVEKEPEIEPMTAAEEAAQQAPRQPSPQDLAALRKRTADLLAQAADTGGLEQILTEVKKEMFDEVRSKVAGLLTQAADNGDLEKILQDVKVSDGATPEQWQLRQKAAQLLTQAAGNGLLESVLGHEDSKKTSKGDAETREEVRARAAKLLAEAAANGGLEKALASLEKEPQKHGEASVRERAAKLLAEAADNGELEKVLGSVKGTPRMEDQLADIRAAAKASLLEAAESGALETIVADLQREKASYLGDVRARAAEMLIEAAETGRLQQVLGEVHQRQSSAREATLLDVRQRAAMLLSEASANGKLEQILGEIHVKDTKGTKADSEALLAAARDKVKSQLQQAAQDGRLETALRALGEEARGETKPSQAVATYDYDSDFEEFLRKPAPAEPKVEEAPHAEGEAALKQRIKTSFLTALDDGSLEEALKSVAGDPGEEAVRQRLEKRLLESLKDGSLEEAVKLALPAPTSLQVPTQTQTVEEFSARMFLEAFAEKGRRLDTLLARIAEAEAQIKQREQRCQQLQAHVAQNKMELAHLDLDFEWCSKLLDSAEIRRGELQAAQRKLLGTLHGKMYELADVTSRLTPRSPQPPSPCPSLPRHA
ncbi:ARGK, partial [Symbiodinium natans]